MVEHAGVVTAPWRPTKAELAAATGRTVPDVIAPGLGVLFCGINPGLYTAAVGHHFARPGNRFWKVLHLAGFTDRLLSPFEETALLASGIGITNLVARATAVAAELTTLELRAGARSAGGQGGSDPPSVRGHARDAGLPHRLRSP